jgi:hypothetical protein
MLYENVFQNPEIIPTQVSLYPEHSTLAAPDILIFSLQSLTIYITVLVTRGRHFGARESV